MNSEKVKEIKEKLREEIFISNSFGDKLRKVPTKELENLQTLINELERENEILHRDYVVKAYDELRVENKKLKDRIAELENTIKNNLQYAKGYGDGVKATVEVAYPKKLTGFAKMLKEKCKERYMLLHNHTCFGDIEFEIDETLKEIINDGRR